MYRILLAIDDSVDHALAQAEAIADMPYDPADVEVTLLHVFTENVSGASVQQIEAARKAEERLADAGIDARMDETSGDPATQILEYAAKQGVDLVCIGGRKRSPTGKALFGSVTQDVILGADQPVIVCGDETE